MEKQTAIIEIRKLQELRANRPIAGNAAQRKYCRKISTIINNKIEWLMNEFVLNGSDI